MKVIFAGTPEFAAVALADLLAAGLEVPLVLTQPDRPAGRGMQPQASPVKQLAQSRGIVVAQPTSLRLDGRYPAEAAQAQQLLQQTPHDVMVVAAYGLILPRWVLDLPRLGCLNIHASLLPRWRGAAPIHRAIEAGDSETGITIMQMAEGLDTGPILLTVRQAIQPNDTTASLHDKLAVLGGRAMIEVLETLACGTLPAVAQPIDGVTYANKISKEEAALDWTLPASVLDCKIRALNPFPGTTACFDNHVLKVWQATPINTPQPAALPGHIIQCDAQQLVVACGQGALRLQVLQKPGGKRLPVDAFLAGFPLHRGQFFSVEN